MDTAAEILSLPKGNRCTSESAANPLKTLAASRQISFQNVSPARSDLLQQALAKADVGLCDYSVTIAVGRIGNNFQVCKHSIVLSERCFSSLPILRLHLRHALELALWLQWCSGNMDEVRSMAVALLAASTATKFYLQMLAAERSEIVDTIPAWLRESAASREKDRLQRLASLLDALMPLQSGNSTLSASADTPKRELQQAVELAREYLPVANPTEFILTQQGDERLLIDPGTGLNKYGCSPRPRPEAITFSSCTASSVSEFAYREAELLRHRLMQTLPRGNVAEQYESEIENIRALLKDLLDLDAQTEVILSSSGTDVELYPLVLLGAPKRKVINIVVAPDEVGSGTVQAARGTHFSTRTPLGASVKQGASIAGLDPVEVISIPIRGSDGLKLDEKQFQQRIEIEIANAVQRADAVILHLVDNSKTGVVAPDADCALELKKKFGEKLNIIVDACQFRLERRNLQRYLADGFWVLITGSKFFTGPPFGGALLIPHFKLTGDEPFPAGFADYFTRSEVPRELKHRAEYLSPGLNLGLLFRWTGAIKEMSSFYTVPSERRTEILQKFRGELVDSIRANPDLRLLDAPTPIRWRDADEKLWDALATIFSFAVRDPRPEKSGKWLTLGELKKLYYLLNRDCSTHLPESVSEADRKLAAQKCHIGQPVTIARCADNGDTTGMRIACGARLVYGITHDDSLGKTPAERFNRELTDAQNVLKKISLILKYWQWLEHEEGFNEAAAVPTEFDER